MVTGSPGPGSYASGWVRPCRRFLLTPGAKSFIFEKRTCYHIVTDGNSGTGFIVKAGALPCFAACPGYCVNGRTESSRNEVSMLH